MPLKNKRSSALPSTYGRPRKGIGRPRDDNRAREIKSLWDPTRETQKACVRGHIFTDENTVWQMCRGIASRRCRKCHNAYHKAVQRERRWEVNLRKSLQAAEKVLLRIIRNVEETDHRVVKLASRFGNEARRRWRVALTTTKRST